jgi:hypothetical protein
MRRSHNLFIGALFMLSTSLMACGGGDSKPSGTGGKSGSGAAGSSTGAAGSSSGAAGNATGAGGSATGSGGSTGAAGSSTGAAGSSTGAGGSATGNGGSGGSTGGAGATGGVGGSTGAGGSKTGTGGSTGAAGASGTGGSTGAGGAGSKPAIATMAQANGNGVMGTATFTPDGTGNIKLVLHAINCPGNGAHSFHIRVNADCGNDGMNSGAIWTKGMMLGTIMCNGGNGGMATYMTPSAGYWTIGTGDTGSDILLHSIVIDMGTEAMPGNPIACGVPRAD